MAAGLPHCNEAHPEAPLRNYNPHDLVPSAVAETFVNACIGHGLPPGKDSCEAVHAEQNALLQCRDPWEIETAYVTLSPCKACLKLLMNTSCKRIAFMEEHVDPLPKELWLKTGRVWEKLDALVG